MVGYRFSVLAISTLKHASAFDKNNVDIYWNRNAITSVYIYLFTCVQCTAVSIWIEKYSKIQAIVLWKIALLLFGEKILLIK